MFSVKQQIGRLKMDNVMTVSINAVRETSSRDYSVRRVIMASCVGTLIEWYDFFIFGSLAVVISPLFFPPGDETLALIAYLMTFAVGFVVRPFGALVFGRIGDLVGRKYAFLVTLLIMGGASTAVGLLPTFQTIGYAAPLMLIAVRVLQGLAVGGEYGGAAVYVAEHVPDHQRGFYTSFIQIAGPLGIFASLAVILLFEPLIKNIYGEEAFVAWGWRVPFLLSIVLVLASLFIRLRMKESPIFQHLKQNGKSSTNPLREAFANKGNLKPVLIAIFGACAGQGVVALTANIYIQYHLTTILKVNPRTTQMIVAAALLLQIPLQIFFGWLSDRIGRKKLMMAACLLAVLCYYPIFKAMTDAAGTNVVAVQSTRNPVTGEYKLTPVSPMTEANATAIHKGKPVARTNEAANPNVGVLILLVFSLMVPYSMIYGPIAAYLVEAFPAKVRYTSVSLPYHIGNGVFGGLVPTIGLVSCAWSGNIYAGLIYPMIIATITFLVGVVMLPETRQLRIWEELER